MKFSITNPDNTADNFEIVVGTVADILKDEYAQKAVCRIWRQLIESEKEYRAPFGIVYKKDEYPEDGPILDAMMKSKQKCYLIKTEQGKIIGIAFTSDTQFKNTYYISDVAVDAEYRGKGIGRRLMEFVLEDNVPGLPTLSVDTTNAHAIDMYRSLGFVDYGIKMVLGNSEQK